MSRAFSETIARLEATAAARRLEWRGPGGGAAEPFDAGAARGFFEASEVFAPDEYFQLMAWRNGAELAPAGAGAKAEPLNVGLDYRFEPFALCREHFEIKTRILGEYPFFAIFVDDFGDTLAFDATGETPFLYDADNYHEREDPCFESLATALETFRECLEAGLAGCDAAGDDRRYWRSRIEIERIAERLNPRFADYWSERIEDSRAFLAKAEGRDGGSTPG